MSGRTYRVTGINLKGIPLGESDRIITILTREQGLIRAVAKGSRKQPSKWGGRMEPFVINELLIARGRWSAQTEACQRLQRIVQVETLQTFPRLGRSLAHLTAAQYLAEVALLLALPDQAQEELFVVLVEHLQRIERAASERAVLPLLIHGLYHLLALAGFAPQVQACHFCGGWSITFFQPAIGRLGLRSLPGGAAAQPNCLGLQFRPASFGIPAQSNFAPGRRFAALGGLAGGRTSVAARFGASRRPRNPFRWPAGQLLYSSHCQRLGVAAATFSAE